MRRALGVLLLHVALVAWLTWPLARQLTTHLADTPWPGSRFDSLLVGWALAHQSRALVTSPARLPHGNAYHPAPDALFYGEAGFGAVPYFMGPFLATGNPTLALNLTFLGCVALTAWALHVVVQGWSGSFWAGLLAGWTFLTARWVLWTWVPAAPNYAVLQYFPFIVLLAARPARRFAAALRLLPLTVLQGLTSAYVAAAVLLPLGLLSLARLCRRVTRPAGLHLLAVVTLTTLVLCLVYSGYLRVRADNPALLSQTKWRLQILGATNLPWGLLGSGPTSVSPVALALIVVGGLGFAFRAVRRTPGLPPASIWFHGAFWVITGVLISMTPTVRWDGRPIALPHSWLAGWIPVYRVLRDPGRLSVAALMGLAILTGAGFAECMRWLPPRARAGGPGGIARLGRGALAAAIAAAMYAGYARGLTVPGAPPVAPLPRAYPVTPAVAPEAVLVDALREPGGPLLELPVGPTLRSHAQAMYRSIFHRRPLLNGYNGYWPAGFPERMALACRLPDAAALAALRRLTGIEVILVHVADLRPTSSGQSPYGCGPVSAAAARAQRAAWMALARQSRADIKLLARDGSDLLFVIRDPGRP